MEEIKKKFLNPDKDFRSSPFWSWNDKLSIQELIRQVEDMKDKGMGGFFMHSREGLETEYLGKDWMEAVKEVVKKAKDIGMNAWLYDEDRWPSGFAGGLVIKKIGDKGREKKLVFELTEDISKLRGDELAIYRIELEGKNIKEILKLGKEGIKEGKGTFLILKREFAKPSPWFNNDTYVDNLNPECVKAFIDTTYEKYYQEVGEEFGRTVPGIFTDEPNIYSNVWLRENKISLPWTDIFPEYFKEKRGYDFFEIAPYIIFRGDKTVKARYDYWRTITELFVEAYSKQLYDWCEKHNLKFTGHYLYENEFGRSILVSGAIMPHYEYQHIPGIDILTEATNEILTVKQASSVAHQLKKERLISELYGCTGWEFTFEGQKWVGDWQYALGVNLRCQHLVLYTLRGCRKRDYPPSFNYHNIWWKYNKIVEDYFARLSYLLTLGKPVREVLVIHPIESAWCEFDGMDFSVADERGRDFQNLCKTLLGLHWDFDLGDESLIEKYGHVDKAKKEFIIGNASYKVVILPPMITIRKKTLELIEEFLDAGGKVIALEPIPEYIEGESNDKLKDLFERDDIFILEGKRALGKLLEELLPRRIFIRNIPTQEAEDFLYMEREYDGKRIFFIVNNDRNKEYEVDISFGTRGRVEEWDPLRGEINQVSSIEINGYQHIRTKFGPAESKIFIIYPNESSILKIEKKFNVKRTIYLGPVFEFRRDNPNVLVLNTCQYRFQGENWSKVMPIWKAQKEIRERLGMPNIHINGINPSRWLWVDKPHPNDNTFVELRLTFMVKDLPKNTYFVIEGANNYNIFINGQKIEKVDGWFLDRSFDELEVNNIKVGENEIILRPEFCVEKKEEEKHTPGAKR